MSDIRKYLQSVILTTIFILAGNSVLGQWGAANAPSIDTSNYIPYIYQGAENYNILIAASKGYSAEIERLLKKGADIEIETSEGATPLVLAVSNNNDLAVKTLIAHGAVVDKVTAGNETPLMIAAKNNFTNIAEQLIRAGADVNFKDIKSATPMHYAALYGYLVMTDLLIYYDADMNAQAFDGSTPLLGAVSAANEWVADLLIQRGADIEIKDYQGLSPFLLSAFYGDTVFMDMLSKHGANIHTLTKNGYNALDLAILSGSKEAVEYLMKLGDWKKPAEGAVNPYDVAAKYNNKVMIQLLAKYQIPGKVSRKIDQASVSISSKFSFHDYFTGFSLTLKEPYHNAGIITGIDTKLWDTKVLYKSDAHNYYQFLDKSSLVYAGIFRDFSLRKYPDASNIFFSTSLSAGYAFGNTVKGSVIKTDNGFRIIPGIGFKWIKMNFAFNLGVEYTQSKFYHTGPVWIRAGVSYNYFFDNIRSKFKPIRWYK